MSLSEGEKRLVFILEMKAEKQKVDLKNFISILHTTIATGSSPTKQNNRIFSEFLNKIFKDKKEIVDDDNLDDIMNLVNNK